MSRLFFKDADPRLIITDSGDSKPLSSVSDYAIQSQSATAALLSEPIYSKHSDVLRVLSTPALFQALLDELNTLVSNPIEASDSLFGVTYNQSLLLYAHDWVLRFSQTLMHAGVEPSYPLQTAFVDFIHAHVLTDPYVSVGTSHYTSTDTIASAVSLLEHLEHVRANTPGFLVMIPYLSKAVFLKQAQYTAEMAAAGATSYSPLPYLLMACIDRTT